MLCDARLTVVLVPVGCLPPFCSIAEILAPSLTSLCLNARPTPFLWPKPFYSAHFALLPATIPFYKHSNFVEVIRPNMPWCFCRHIRHKTVQSKSRWKQVKLILFVRHPRLGLPGSEKVPVTVSESLHRESWMLCHNHYSSFMTFLFPAAACVVFTVPCLSLTKPLFHAVQQGETMQIMQVKTFFSLSDSQFHGGWLIPSELKLHFKMIFRLGRVLGTG